MEYRQPSAIPPPLLSLSLLYLCKGQKGEKFEGRKWRFRSSGGRIAKTQTTHDLLKLQVKL